MILFAMTIESEMQRANAGKAILDEGLILRVASGDRTAFAQLYEGTRHAVFGYALSILRSRANAEDVLQDTYLKVWGSAAAYQPQGKPMAWILTITRNLALMKLREKRNHDLPLTDGIDPPDMSDSEDARLDRMALELALDTLSHEERQIVLLHSLSGLKHREIAEILHLPLSTELSKNRRALKKLEKLMKEES